MTVSKAEFIEVLEQHKAIIYQIARSYSKEPEERKDLEQEIVIQIWKSLKNYNPEYKLSTWIYRICLNVAISHLRKDSSRKEKITPMSESILDLPSNGDEHETLSERRKILYTVINQLDVFNRALVLLHLDEKNHKEISQIMGISESNVGTKLNRIKSILKQNIELENA